jgi:SOS-response transcriptional repressor LexA
MLSARQQQVLDFIRTFVAKEKLSPTLKEIRTALGMCHSRVYQHLVELETKGAITREPHCGRSIRIVEEG